MLITLLEKNLTRTYTLYEPKYKNIEMNFSIDIEDVLFDSQVKHDFHDYDARCLGFSHVSYMDKMAAFSRNLYLRKMKERVRKLEPEDFLSRMP